MAEVSKEAIIKKFIQALEDNDLVEPLCTICKHNTCGKACPYYYAGEIEGIKGSWLECLDATCAHPICKDCSGSSKFKWKE